MKKPMLALFLAVALTLGMVGCVGAVAEEEPLHITGLAALYSSAPEKDSDFWKWMEDYYNVDYDVEWSSGDKMTEKIGLLCSTGELPDIIQTISMTDPIIVNAVKEGMFYDLTDLIPEYENLANLSQTAWNNSSVNGRNYCIPRSRGQYNCTMFVRGDILKEMGVGVPATLSEYEEYFRYCKEHYDMVPVASPLSPLYDFFLGAFGDGSRNPVYTEDGTGIVWYQFTESYAKMVEWLQKLYKEGLLASEFALITGDNNSDLFLTGQTAIRWQNIWHYYRLQTTLQAVPGFENSWLEMALYATSDDGKYKSLNYDIGYYGGLLLNAELSEEKVRAILDFLNKTADPDMYNIHRYGIEGVHWNMVDGYPKATEKGKAEVTNSFYSPFCLATATYDKVISPLCDAEFNNEVIEKLKVHDSVVDSIDGIPLCIFQVISSDTWSENWGYYSTEFDGYVTETIAGNHTIDELRAYQAKLAAEDWAQESFVEFAKSFEMHHLDKFYED